MKIDDDRTSVAVDYWQASCRTDVDDGDNVVYDFSYPYKNVNPYVESIKDGNPTVCYVDDTYLDEDVGELKERVA